MDHLSPDLSPPYPSVPYLQSLLAPSSQLVHTQRANLVKHSLARACLFADLPLLSFLLHNPASQNYLDLDAKDEDGLSLVSQSILGFNGSDSDRDLEREECIRLLIAEGVNLDSSDAVGWTALHHAALLAPATLVAFLLTHGASPLIRSRKQLTPLDIISAYKPLPGRQDVTLLLEDAMRERGWEGSPSELRRKDAQKKREAAKTKASKRAEEWNRLGKVLDIGDAWWGPISDTEDEDSSGPDDGDDLEDECLSEHEFTPLKDYVLVFSLSSLPNLLHTIVAQAEPVVYPTSRRSAPANSLYMLARFACLQCDASWLDALLSMSVDKIEEVVYARPDRPEDLAHLAFWLYNSTLLLHLLKCDKDLSDMCHSLDIFPLLEELVNAIYVFVIRVVEKRIDGLIDPALLDHSPLSNEFDSVQFESDWSFLRSLTPKRKAPLPVSPASVSLRSRAASSANSPPPSNVSSRPPSPAMGHPTSPKTFSSLRQTITRSSGVPSPHTPLSTVFTPASPVSSPTPASIASILTSLHTLLSLYCVNPVLVIQAYSQILYWISCEVFNRMLTRKKYLCRSRAIQIGLNIGVLEEWVGTVGLPSGVVAHFTAVKELSSWLQCHSSIDQFPSLVDTIQSTRALNPLQMRRAVRDYRYEVNEGRMTEECAQYLAQLQKDWERRRIKLGVEALRKEIGERNRDRAESVTSGFSGPPADEPPSNDVSVDDDPPDGQSDAQLGVDLLFDRDRLKAEWVAPKPPNVLGELLDSTYMLPLALPSDPELLCARPGPSVAHILEEEDKDRRRMSRDMNSLITESRSVSRCSVGNRGAMQYRKRPRAVRNVMPDDLIRLVDGGRSIRAGTTVIDTQVDSIDDLEEIDSFTAPLHAITTPQRLKSSPSWRRRVSRESGTTVPSDFEDDEEPCTPTNSSGV